MFALIGSEFILVLAAALIGFALGWRVRAWSHGLVQKHVESDVEDLKRRLGDAQVRRAGHS